MRFVPGLGRRLAVAVLIVTASTQPVFLLGAAFPDMSDEFGYGAAGLGALTAMFFITASVTSPAMGRLVGRIGWRAGVRLNAVFSGCITVAIAVFAMNTVTLAVMLVAGGAIYGMANPAANQALAELVDPRHRALLFGMKHGGIPTSTLLAGLAVPVLVVTVGWRAAYVVGAVVAIIALAVVPSGGHEAAPVMPPADPRRAVSPLSGRQLAAMAFAGSLATTAAVALSTYLVAAAVDIGFSESQGGLLLFGGSIASISMRVLMGEATDRAGGRGFAAMGSLMGAGIVVFVLLTGFSGAWFSVLVVLGFGTGWAWPGLMTYTVVNANRGTVASSSAITQAGVFVGAGLSPLLLGVMVEEWGFDAAWWSVAAALTVATAVVVGVGTSARSTSRLRR